jgi:hypothetical protein
MKNIVCIDLRMFNHIKLKEVCDMYGFDYQTLLSTKTQGFAKIWINKDTMKTFAFTVKKDDTVRFTDDFAKEISEIKPIEPIKQERSLDLDSILEKISMYGIGSLKPNEKEFLDNLK